MPSTSGSSGTVDVRVRSSLSDRRLLLLWTSRSISCEPPCACVPRSLKRLCTPETRSFRGPKSPLTLLPRRSSDLEVAGKRSEAFS